MIINIYILSTFGKVILKFIDDLKNCKSRINKIEI